MTAPFPTNKEVINVCVTGAAGQIGYSLVPMIANGLMLGANQPVQITMLDLPLAVNPLNALAMELQDCNFRLVHKVVATTDPTVAFPGADIVVMCGAFPRKEGMERKDLLLKNAEIFKAQGLLMRDLAPNHCRVLVVGNPANTNALLLSQGAWDNGSGAGIHPTQITALTRLDQNRAASEAKRYLNLPGDAVVENVIIWGNHSSTQVPDVFSGKAAIFNAAGAGGQQQQPSALLLDKCESDEQKAYFSMGFFPYVQQRGAAVIKARGASSAASAAKAIVDHVRDWILGTAPGVYASMAVSSNGNSYGIPDGLVFSFPCMCQKGEWAIQGGLQWSDLIKQRIEATTKELEEEREQAMSA